MVIWSPVQTLIFAHRSHSDRSVKRGDRSAAHCQRTMFIQNWCWYLDLYKKYQLWSRIFSYTPWNNVQPTVTQLKDELGRRPKSTHCLIPFRPAFYIYLGSVSVSRLATFWIDNKDLLSFFGNHTGNVWIFPGRHSNAPSDKSECNWKVYRFQDHLSPLVSVFVDWSLLLCLCCVIAMSFSHNLVSISRH